MKSGNECTVTGFLIDSLGSCSTQRELAGTALPRLIWLTKERIMRIPRTICAALLLCFGAPAADHNDPNAVNSIFSDNPVSASDLYDLFGYPSDDKTGGQRVVVMLTFASVPKAGVFDTDMLY